MKSTLSDILESRRPLVVFCLFFLALTFALCLFYWPFLARQQSFYLFNVTFYFEPLCRFIGDAFRHGRLPLWNPYSYLGMPQVAIPSPGIFYPFNWLFGFLNFSQALAIIMVAHQLIAGVGGFLVVFSAGWGLVAACVCGLTLALCGYMFGLENNYTLMASAAWLPLLFWSVRRIQSGIATKNIAFVCLCSLVTFLFLAAGRPEISLPGILFVVGYILYSLWKSETRQSNWRGVLFWQALSLFLGLLLAMPEILPAWEWAGLSRRAHGLDPQEIFLWSANWYDYLCILLLQPLGDVSLVGSKFLPVVQSRAGAVPFLSSAYIGPVAFTLAIWAISDQSWKHRYFLLACLVVGTILSLGNQTPIDSLFVNSKSIFALFRYPVKLIFFPVLCLIIMAARGTYLACAKRVSPVGKISALAFWGLGIVGGAGLTLFPESASKLVAMWSVAGKVITPAKFVESTSLIGQAGLRASAAGLLICCLSHFYWQGKLREKIYVGLLLLMLSATLLTSAFAFARHGTYKEFFDSPSYLADKLNEMTVELNMPEYKSEKAIIGVDKPRIAVLYSDPFLMPPQYKDPFNWDAKSSGARTAAFYQYGRQMLFPNTHIDAGLSSIFCFEAAETNDWHELFWQVVPKSHLIGDAAQTPRSDLPLARVCQMSGTKYATTQIVKYRDAGQALEKVPLLDPAYFDVRAEDPNMNVRIYEVKNVLPRARFADTWQISTGHSAVIDQIVAAETSGFDPHKMLIVEPSADGKLVLAANGKGQIQKEQFVTILEDKPEHVAISAKVNHSGFVVLADQFYPGWKAKVDSVSAPIYCANAVERAVFIPQGSHLVEFDYDPDSLKSGTNLAFCASGILFVFLLYIYFRLMIGMNR